jgi:DNA invertase Pin-like site-specific DNA recombinase
VIKTTDSSSLPSKGDARLDKTTANSVVKMLESGESPAKVAKDLDIGYMSVYKIATGKTWKGLTGGQRLIGERTTRMGSKHREYVRKAKDKGKTNAYIARKLQVSETTVARLVRDNALIDAHRLRTAVLSSGDQDSAARAVGIKPRRAEALLLFAISNPLPKRLQEYVE